MKTIPLRNSELVGLVDDKDFERCMARGWCLAKDGYIVSTSLPRARLHSFVYGQKYLDHKNTDKLDCQKGNLRPATTSQNGGNRKRGKNNTTGFKGVNYNYGKYRAQVNVRGVRIYMGRFLTAEAAALAYDLAAKKNFGEYARLNFPELG
jgi:hypothetical protein